MKLNGLIYSLPIKKTKSSYLMYFNIARVINIFVLIIFFAIISASHISAQNKNLDYLSKSWKQVATQMNESWYGSDEARMVADSVLKYQTEIGGWPKNSGFHNGSVKQSEMLRIKSSGIGATFDNGATITEMKFLAKIYSKIRDDRYRASFMKGFEYILKAQYPNGGWPQFYPFRKGKSVSYASHITYNDNAMLNIMLFLRDIANGKDMYAALNISNEMKLKVQTSFDKGIDCILKTQIIKNGKPTVWCSQHDEVTLLPANARAYELASFSGSESVGITFLLMDIENPSQKIIEAIKGAVNWYETHKIEGIKLIEVTNKEGLKDKMVVNDTNAQAIWARFYDLETGEPYFCDRDGIKRKTLAEIGYDRRNGYDWYTNSPDKLLEKYAQWTKKLGMKIAE